eukprot:gene27620-33355_t
MSLDSEMMKDHDAYQADTETDESARSEYSPTWLKDISQWHQPDHDNVTRKLVVAEIVLLLRARKPSSSKSSRRIPHMAVRIEERLYEVSTSYDEYSDLSTLGHRVEQLAQRMSRNSSGSQSNSFNTDPCTLEDRAERAMGINVQLVKQEQERLLLLRHASRCPHRLIGQCPVTPHCFHIQQLWQHVLVCRDSSCLFAHCLSSRTALVHYSECKDAGCPVCAPVRLLSKRNCEYEAARGLQELGLSSERIEECGVGQKRLFDRHEDIDKAVKAIKK